MFFESKPTRERAMKSHMCRDSGDPTKVCVCVCVCVVVCFIYISLLHSD